MTIKITQIIGGAIMLGTIGFGWTMDSIAEVNKDHMLVAEFQRGTTPSPGYTEAVEAVVELLDANPNYMVSVIGHTGTRGPEEGNMTLSLQRVDKVIRDLVSEGVDRDRIEGIGRGETDPLVQGDHETDALWQKRMSRVEFVVEVQ